MCSALTSLFERVARESSVGGTLRRPRRCCLAILVGFDTRSISGGVTQSASPAVAPRPSLFLDRLAIQLAGFRHGLLLYAPIHLVGFAGVLVAIRHRTQIGVLLFLLPVTYMFVFVWGVASESYTARFWVVAMPIVLLGTVLWIDRAWNVAAAVGVDFPIAVYTLVMTVALFNSSQLFLENRFHSVVFDELVEKGVPFNFALYASWDPFDLKGIEMIGEEWTAGVLTVLAGLLLAFVLLCARGARARAVGMAAAIGLSGLVGYWSYLESDRARRGRVRRSVWRRASTGRGRVQGAHRRTGVSRWAYFGYSALERAEPSQELRV